MRNNPVDLYLDAERFGIEVAWFPLWADRSMAIQLEDQSCAIALDPWKMETLSQENVSLGHELGHCCTGSFYNPYAALDIRQKHENRADKWAIRRLVPADELRSAMEAGCTDLWSLAELFDVTPEFMRKSICWYENGNLAVEHFL